jgi:hypothetical protein
MEVVFVKVFEEEPTRFQGGGTFLPDAKLFVEPEIWLVV